MYHESHSVVHRRKAGYVQNLVYTGVADQLAGKTIEVPNFTELAGHPRDAVTVREEETEIYQLTYESLLNKHARWSNGRIVIAPCV